MKTSTLQGCKNVKKKMAYSPIFSNNLPLFLFTFLQIVIIER